MEKRGHNALLPFPFLVGAGTVFIVWAVGVYMWERLSNFLVLSGLLVSSKKPHFITLIGSDLGMDWRTIGALIGVMMFVGGVFTIFGHVGHTDRNTVDELDRPSRPAGDSIPQMDPMMDPMMGMPGMGGMDPMMGMPGMGGGGMPFPPPPPGM